MRPRGGLLSAGATCLLTMMLASSTAFAQQLAGDGSADAAAGRAAFEAADFDTALRAFERAARSPAATPETLVEAHRYLASLRAALGDARGAALDAEAALAIDPVAAPPPGAPPSAAEIFDRTRAARGGERAAVSVELPAAANPAAPGAARVRVRGLPAGAGWRAAVVCESEGARAGTAEITPEGADAEAPVVLGPVRAGATLTCLATLRTAGGAVVRSETASRAFAPPAPRPRAAERPRGLPRWVWPGVGGGAVVVAAVVTVAIVAAAGSRPAEVQLGAPSVEP